MVSRVLETSLADLRAQVLTLLREDGRWLRGATVIRRMINEPSPSLEDALQRGGVDEEGEPVLRAAWRIYVEVLVPLVHEGALEGEGNFGAQQDGRWLPGEAPVDAAFVRVRARR
ncbi:MAG: hypothetical protein AAGE52_17705 [Myxococcota bacterium]